VPLVSSKFQLAGVQVHPYPTGFAPVAIPRAKPCKLPGFGAVGHAICTECLTKKTRARPLDIPNALNGNVPEEENPAAQFKLNPGAWNV